MDRLSAPAGACSCHAFELKDRKRLNKAHKQASTKEKKRKQVWRHITANIHVPHHANIEVISNIQHAHYSTYFRN